MSDFITSRMNSKVKAASLLKSGVNKLFLVEGFHNVEMALKQGAIKEVFSLKEMPNIDVPLHVVTKEIIDKLSSVQNPEGIVAVCEKKEGKPFSSDRLLYLDLIQDPGNVGTLLRTALSFGFHDVLLSKNSCDPYNSKVLLASQGAIFALNVKTSIVPSSEDIKSLKAQGYLLLGTSLDHSVPFEGFKVPKGKICLILGNEGKGVEKEVLALTDQNITITMSGIDSLNVGVAGGILMHGLAL